MKPPAVSLRPRSPQAAAAARGFTLIELMIAVAIVGLLAAIAYPSYLAYLTRTDRTDATTSMFTDAQILQRCYSQTYSYTECLTTFTPAPAGVTQLSAGPTATPDGYYDVSITSSSADQYTITAKPAANSPENSDSECTSFTLDSSGTQGSTGTAQPATCWGSN